jgi:hypothetical protein
MRIFAHVLIHIVNVTKCSPHPPPPSTPPPPLHTHTHTYADSQTRDTIATPSR